MRKVLLILGIVMFAGLLNCFSQTSVFPDPMDARLAYAREEVLNEHFNEAVVRYARVLQTDENKTVCSEYAFALALSGCYDGAIMYLDKVMVSSKANVTTLFYISLGLYAAALACELAGMAAKKEGPKKLAWWVFVLALLAHLVLVMAAMMFIISPSSPFSPSLTLWMGTVTRAMMSSSLSIWLA